MLYTLYVICYMLYTLYVIYVICYIRYMLYTLYVICYIRYMPTLVNKGNNKITELRTILQRESQNS